MHPDPSVRSCMHPDPAALHLHSAYGHHHAQQPGARPPQEPHATRTDATRTDATRTDAKRTDAKRTDAAWPSCAQLDDWSTVV